MKGEIGYDASRDSDRIAVALLGLLQRQLHNLGFELEGVPPIGLLVEQKCRGYLFGLSCGILIGEGIRIDRDALTDTLIAAFALVYGDEQGRALAQQTFEEIGDEHPDAVHASEWAINEVKGVYADAGNEAAGFYLAAMGVM